MAGAGLSWRLVQFAGEALLLEQHLLEKGGRSDGGVDFVDRGLFLFVFGGFRDVLLGFQLGGSGGSRSPSFTNLEQNASQDGGTAGVFLFDLLSRLIVLLFCWWTAGFVVQLFWLLFHANAGRIRALRFQYSIVLQASPAVVMELVQRFHAFFANPRRVVIFQGYL